MFSKTLTTWIGLAGLTIALAGCGDDGGSGDTNNTTDPTGNATTDPTGATTDPTGSATTDPTGSATTDPTGSATTDPGDSSSGGGAECDPACADNEECIEGVCFPTGGDTTGDPPPTDGQYGPCAAGCPEGTSGAIIPEGFCFCAPMCDGAMSMCPNPPGSTATPACALTMGMSMNPTSCALVCMSADDCPGDAECVDAGGASICTHPQ